MPLVCELHEQRRLASLGTHHQGSSPALTPTPSSLRRKTESRGRKCEKATVNFKYDQSIERVQIGMAHGLIRNYMAKLCRSMLHKQALLDLDNFEGEATDVLHVNSIIEKCWKLLDLSWNTVTSFKRFKSMLMWKCRALRSCPLSDNDKCIAEAQESTCQPRGKETLTQTSKQAVDICTLYVFLLCFVFLRRWKDQGTKHFSWIFLLTDRVYEVLYCDGSK